MLLSLAALASAQQAAVGATPAPSETGFDIRIDAPAAIAQLLERHMELQRYRALTDLSDTEIQSLLTAAQQNAADLLATLGYFSADIQIQLLPLDVTARKVVQVTVQSGPQARVRSVELVLEGAIAEDPEAREQRQLIRDLWSLGSGEPFSQDAWNSAKARALKQLVARRYATGRLVSSRADVQPEANTVDLELRLDSGPAYKVGRLDVKGIERYGTDLVARFARLPAGEDYQLSQLVEAQQRLTDSGYFDAASLTLDTESDPAQAVVRAQVKEASMQKAVLGIGVSSDTGARVSAEHTYNQVPGIHWRAVNKVTLARDTQSFASDWTSQPTESRWRWAASALFQQEDVSDIQVSGERYRTGRFTTDKNLDQSYYLQYERTRAAYEPLNLSLTNEAVTANYAFSWRHFDSTPFPSSGWGIGGELAAGSALGDKQEPYTRALVHVLLYQPLGQDLMNLFARQHAGRMMYRAQAGGVFVDNATSVPFSQLFLTGGDTSVRGYRFDEIGVTRDGLLTADSGRYLATAGVEWQRPIVRKGVQTDWESVVFVDTGAVSNKLDELNFKSGVGVGARWKSPIGPLQIDAAYGVATQAFRLHVNVGFVF